MSQDDPKGWDAGLADLLQAERENVTAPDHAEERVWKRVAVDLGPGGGAGGGAGPGPGLGGGAGAGLRRGRWLGVSSQGLGVYALGVVSGVVGSLLVLGMLRRGPAAPVGLAPSRATSAETAPVDRELVPLPVLAALAGTADANVERVAPSVPALPSVTPAVRSSATLDHSLEGERVLLDAARAALGRGDGAAALGATAAHEQRYPHGLLAEEREAIAIEALLLVPRYDDARQREALFEQRFPHSMLLQAVRASIQSIP